MILKVIIALQAWISTPDMGYSPAKNRVIYAENWFTMDTVVWHEVKYFFLKSYQLKTQMHLVSIDLPCYDFSFYGHCKRQFTYAIFGTPVSTGRVL